jgi:hypothetical protein
VAAIGGVRAEVPTGPGPKGPPTGTVLGNLLCISVKKLPTLQGLPRAPRSELPPLVQSSFYSSGSGSHFVESNVILLFLTQL